MKFPSILSRVLKAPLDFFEDPIFIKGLLTKRKIPQFSWGLLISRRATKGYCPVCEQKTIIVQFGPMVREHYLCGFCGSNPRQRALLTILNRVVPQWPTLRLFESSPGGISSDFLEKRCPAYQAAHFFQDVAPGGYKEGVRSENLEALTYPDQTFDLVITQDVFEHILNPDRGFQEIERVLKPGGLHVFTVPFNQEKKTVFRAVETPRGIRHLQEEIYHGNPIDPSGSLVTVDWGHDLVDFIYNASGLVTTVYCLADRLILPREEPLEVFVSRKKAPRS